jgi:hypothetical protein
MKIHAVIIKSLTLLTSMLQIAVNRRPRPPNNLQQLAQALVAEWRNIPQATVRRCIQNMPARCQAAITARGGNTRYIKRTKKKINNDEMKF